MISLQFFGATRSVTGSCFLIQHGPTHLLVDCGLIQGPPEAAVRDRQPFPFDPSSLDAVVLIHAHLDHTGLTPRLFVEGFRGRLITTGITKDLLPILWEDFVHLQQLGQLDRRVPFDHAEPSLYGAEEVRKALQLCEG